MRYTKGQCSVQGAFGSFFGGPCQQVASIPTPSTTTPWSCGINVAGSFLCSGISLTHQYSLAAHSLSDPLVSRLLTKAVLLPPPPPPSPQDPPSSAHWAGLIQRKPSAFFSKPTTLPPDPNPRTALSGGPCHHLASLPNTLTAKPWSCSIYVAGSFPSSGIYPFAVIRTGRSIISPQTPCSQLQQPTIPPPPPPRLTLPLRIFSRQLGGIRLWHQNC